MTPREFRQEQEFEFDHFQELTSTGIKPNYVNIELFAHEYHKRKLKLLGIADVGDIAVNIDELLEKMNKIRNDEAFKGVLSFDYPNEILEVIDALEKLR